MIKVNGYKIQFDNITKQWYLFNHLNNRISADNKTVIVGYAKTLPKGNDS